ncbi:hypothetical protein TRVL_08978 [Trypanosoma vivax]|nr:hypothetical protein TRVL_08978 [Trypanosoma vivax]
MLRLVVHRASGACCFINSNGRSFAVMSYFSLRLQPPKLCSLRTKEAALHPCQRDLGGKDHAGHEGRSLQQRRRSWANEVVRLSPYMHIAAALDVRRFLLLIGGGVERKF